MTPPPAPARLDSILAEQPFAVLDGGLATELEARGHDLGDALWSARVLADDPAAIRSVHLDYLRAGADIITTASYQATVPGLVRRGHSGAEAGRIIARSVELAREARDEYLAGPAARSAVLIAGSVGPYGAYLSDGSEYTGGYGLTGRELKRFHQDRLAILIEAGVDLIACETMPSLREAEAIVDLMERRGNVAGWVAFSARGEDAIADGTPFAEAVATIGGAGSVVAAGVNCTPVALMAPLLERAESPKPLIVYPNAGGQYDAASKRWIGGGGVDEIERQVERWHRLGARIIGGCCRTGPTTTAALRRSFSGPEERSTA